MRTKTMLLGAAIMAAGALSSMAQTSVYSLNVVGYVSVPIAGNPAHNGGNGDYTLVANPLDASNGGTGSNDLNTLFPNAQFFDAFLGWDPVGGQFVSSTYVGSWSPDLNLNPGQGGFYNTTVAQTNTFVGTVLQGLLTNSFPAGVQAIGDMVPVTTDADASGLSANMGFFDQIQVWNSSLNAGNGGFDLYTFVGGGPGGWSGPAGGTSAPAITPGIGFFMNTASGETGATAWVQNFTVH